MQLCVLCFAICEALCPGPCSILSPRMDDGQLVAATCFWTISHMPESDTFLIRSALKKEGSAHAWTMQPFKDKYVENFIWANVWQKEIQNLIIGPNRVHLSCADPPGFYHFHFIIDMTFSLKWRTNYCQLLTSISHKRFVIDIDNQCRQPQICTSKACWFETEVFFQISQYSSTSLHVCCCDICLGNWFT